MNAEELRTYLTKNGLGRVADQLVAVARPGIRIHTHPTPEAEIPIGSSKMGGLPDLPSDTDWPVLHESMAFIGQFNLAEVYPFDQEKLLPESGLLSFFYETNGEPGYAEDFEAEQDLILPPSSTTPREWRVLYFDTDPSQLTRRQRPADLNKDAHFPPCKLSFEVALTLPETDSPELDSINLTLPEFSQFPGCLGYINRNLDVLNLDRFYGQPFEMVHQLLGYPAQLEEGLFYAAESDSLYRSGIKGYSRHEIASGHSKWQLLLQIDSSSDLQMDWAGGGIVHYCIRSTDLKKKDFSQIFLHVSFL